MASEGKPNKVVLAAVAVVHVTVMRLTWRDLRSRPAGLVRGPKLLWRLASALNTSGSAAYWLFGRRRPAHADRRTRAGRHAQAVRAGTRGHQATRGRH